MHRAKDRLKVTEVDFDLNEHSSAFLKKALELSGTQWKEFAKTVLKLAMELTSKERTTKLDSAESGQFVNHVLDQLDGFVKRLKGKSTAVRFSPPALRAALSLYLRTPKGYDKLQESGLFVMPPSRRLRLIKSLWKVNSGQCLSIYERHADCREGYDSVEIGHLICDEMRLTSGIFYNCQSKEIVGFKDDLQDFEKQAQALMDDCELTFEPAKYVKQWKYRSTSSKTFLCEFFYNSGSLSGKTTLRQMLHVITACEMVGCQVHGICCDAGDSNASLYTLLRYRKTIPVKDMWLNENLVSFASPWDPTRKV